MIEISNLKLTRKNFNLQINDIHISKGDKIGVIGHNGAGKSTLINCIIDEVKYLGKIKKNSNNIAVHLQFNNYFSTKIKYIIEAIIKDKIKNNERIKELIEYFDFNKNLDKKFSNLSGGEKQKLTLILVLYQNADIVILDEVTSGFDFETRDKLTKKLQSYLSGKDKTVLMVSHYYEELIGFVDKIMMLDNGRVIAFDYLDKLFFKYIGKSVIIFEKNNVDKKIFSKYHEVLSKGSTLAYSFIDEEEEKEFINILIQNNIDFKRSTNDIEVLTLNILKGERNEL